MRLSAFQPAAVAPGKPTCTQPGSGLHCSGSPHWREEQPSTLAGEGRAPFFPFRSPRPPSVAGPPAAAERPQPLTAWPAPRRPEPRGGASACGAGRARAGRLGESARAERSGAGRCWGETRGAGPAAYGSAPILLRRWSQSTSTSVQAPAKLYSLGPPPGCLKESEHWAGSALPCCGGDRGDLHPAELSSPAPPHLVIAPRSSEGSPTKGLRGRQRPRTLPPTVADPPGTTLT